MPFLFTYFQFLALSHFRHHLSILFANQANNVLKRWLCFEITPVLRYYLYSGGLRTAN